MYNRRWSRILKTKHVKLAIRDLVANMKNMVVQSGVWLTYNFINVLVIKNTHIIVSIRNLPGIIENQSIHWEREHRKITSICNVFPDRYHLHFCSACFALLSHVVTSAYHYASSVIQNILQWTDLMIFCNAQYISDLNYRIILLINVLIKTCLLIHPVIAQEILYVDSLPYLRAG